MKTKIQIKSVLGKLLFEYEKENNTIKDTLLKAIEDNVNLSFANLRGANLRGSDLRGANLRGANLRGSDLSFAYLIDANLSNANLRGANLSDVNLSNANLRGANLRGSDLSFAYLPIFCKWDFSIKGNLINIGCKSKTIEEWNKFFDSDEEYSTKRGTDEFKQIQAVYNALKSYLETLTK